MEVVVTGAVVGKGVSLLVDKVLEEVKLLAKGDDRFRGLQSLLSRLQEPTDYLVNHEDKAGETLVHTWLEDLRKELAKAESLVTKWPKIRRWNLRGRQKALKRLIRITENLDRMDNSQTVALASNVHNFGRLGEGVDRLGEEVKTYVENLTSEVRSLNMERRELARATEDALAPEDPAKFREKIEEVKRKVLGTSDSGANPEAGSRTSRSSEAVPHFNAQDSFPDEVFGGNDILDEVIEKILHGDYRKCIGLWNMGGAGKTFTAGRVFHDPRIQSYFDGKRFWVTVAKRESYSIMEEIFVKVGGRKAHFPAADDVYGVRSALKGRLNLGKFLLVIDDVWEAAQLDFIDLISEPEDSKRAVILVTTRLQEILDRKHATKIAVPLLSEDVSWQLFSRNAFGRAPVPSNLEEVSRSVAAECKGLPLALKIIGSTLAGENTQVWENSLKKLKHASVLSKEHEVQVFGRLQLSVDNLRDRDESDSRLQHCFYYFAAYPEDKTIRPQELVALWTAEGVVGKDPDSPISPKSEAYELLGTLIGLSMIEALQQINSFLVKIHDVMRDLARYNLENNFGKGFSITEKIPACRRLCLYRPGLQLRTFPKDWTTVQGADSSTSITLSVERLSFTYNQLQQLPEQFDAPRLRVLLLGENFTLTLLPARFFESFRSLRVLDLQRTGIEEIPEAVLNLISLVLLNLEGCRLLRQIPASIERLQNLEQLRLGYCSSLKSLPGSLRSLTFLKGLYAEGTYIWDSRKSSSKDIATFQDLALLKSLEVLCIASFSSSPVSEIGQLSALHNVMLSCPKWKELPGDFTKLVNLKTLSLYCSCSKLPELDKFKHLRKLFLTCSELESFPVSFGQRGAFPSLQTFKSGCGRLKGFTIQPGAMSQVKSFTIGNARNMELPASFRGLGSLVYLEVSNCESLEDLSAFEEPNSFPYLEKISFFGSRSFRILPTGMLKAAPNLRSIDLRRTNVSRSDIPEDLLEKERLKKLEIDI